MHRPPLATLAALVVLGLVTAGAGATSTFSTAPAADRNAPVPRHHPSPSHFTHGRVDNRWFPLDPGTVWTYRTTGDLGERTEVVTVTDRTRVVQGVTTTLVRDVLAGDNGKVVTETVDAYAQDVRGNVWLLGADVTAYHHGRRDTTGSWEAGVHGAEAGVVMAAQPRLGDGYVLEHAPGVAEDQAEVLSVTDQRTVPQGEYDHLVQLAVSSPLVPARVEHRYYAPGVGLVYEETVSGGSASMELVGLSRG